MIKGSKNELDQIIQKCGCPEHPDAALTVCWDAAENSHVIRCRDHYPEEVKPLPTRTEEYKRGELEVVDKSFTLMPRADLETGEVLSAERVHALVAYAERYGLDPARGHVVIMHGLPYIGLDGYLFYARAHHIPYSLTGRPLTQDEMTSLLYEVGDLGWKSTVTRHDTGTVCEGLGFVTKADREKKSINKPDKLRYPVVADKPVNMVIKRADWQALRRTFPIGEEVDNENTK